MERCSLTRVSCLFLTLMVCCQQQRTSALLTELCPTAVELLISIQKNSVYEILTIDSLDNSYSIFGGNEIQITCRSKSPVNISFEGLLPNPLTSANTTRIIDSKDSSCYEIKITLPSKSSATGRYTCLDASAFIYANGNNPPFLLNAGRSRSLDGFFTAKSRAILPCITTNKSLPVHLYKNGNDLTSHEGIKYDPKEGFSFNSSELSDTSFYGIYTCSILDKNRAYNVSVKLAQPIISDPTTNNQIVFEVQGDDIRCNGATSMTYFKCNSPIECEFIRGCKNGPTSPSCNKRDFYHDWTNKNSDSIQFTRSTDDRGGLILCSTWSSTQEFNFFTDFNNKAVTNLKNVSLEQYKFMDFIPIPYNTWDDVEEFFEQESISFKCNASKLIFSQGLRWEFELEDGSVKLATIINETLETDQVAYTLTSLLNFDDTNIIKLICRAPRIDSDEWHILSKDIIVRPSSVPVFNHELNETHTFKDNETTTTINCSATGLPLPTMTWTKVGQDYDTIPTTTYDLNGNTSTSLLKRTTAEIGVYKCNATNIRGTKLKYITLVPGKQRAINVINDTWIALIATLVLILVFTTAALAYFYFKNKQTESKFPKHLIDEFLNGRAKSDKTDYETITKSDKLDNENNTVQTNVDTDNLTVEADEYIYLPYPTENEIPNPEKNLIIGKELGKGNFGLVRLAKLTLDGQTTDVAVKSVLEGATDDIFDDFLKELKLMNYVGNHENVIKFIGGVTNHIDKRQALIVVEYCPFNDLKNFLPKQKTLFQNQFAQPQPGQSAVNMPTLPNYTQIAQPTTTTDLINWSYQIACGMDHLASRRLVHRDLAARNVLLDSNRVAKVTDFGLSRELRLKDYYPLLQIEGKRLPVRWFAPEAMTLTETPKFSTDSDVWAFGITIAEIFSLGDNPYPNIPDSEAAPFLLRSFLNAGERMEKPEFANDEVYKIMQSCWEYEGSKRPRFSALKDSISAVGIALSNDLSQPSLPAARQFPSGFSTSDFSLSDDENFDFDNAINGYDDESV